MIYIPQRQSRETRDIMARSHPSDMSCNTTSTAPPWSVNYITANTRQATANTALSRPKYGPIIFPAPTGKNVRGVQFIAKAKRAFTSAKQGLKAVSTLARSDRRSSVASVTSCNTRSPAGSRLSMRVSQPVTETPSKCSSTPSISPPKSTYKGSNVCLSMHQAPPTPEASQIVIPTYGDSTVRLSIHQGPPTPEVTQTQTFLLDASPVSPEAPLLPYIAFTPAMQLDISRKASSAKTNEPPTEEQTPAPAAASSETTDVSHPNTLTIGVEMPLSQPRTTTPRPHTTGELIPGANLLPYIAYNPRFNPYNRSPSPAPSRTLNQTTSASDLAAAFAEAEAAEEAVRHKRHTTLYADVEAGMDMLSSASAAPAPPAHQIRRRPVPGATQPAAETASAASTTAPAPEPTLSPAPAPAPLPAPVPTPAPLNIRTSKPLPPPPSKSSPRRYTNGIVPPSVPHTDDDITAPIMSSMAIAEESERSRANETKSKGERRRFKGLRKLLRKLRF